MADNDAWRFNVRVGYARITDAGSLMHPAWKYMQPREGFGDNLRDAITMFEVGENVVILNDKDFLKLWNTAQRTWAADALLQKTVTP